MNQVHVMADLETLGRKPGCVVLSIGAVRFDPLAPMDSPLNEQFHVRLEVEEQERLGLRVEAETALWWMDQGEAAQHLLKLSVTPHLSRVLNLFRGFCAGSTTLWSNPPRFDVEILESLHTAAGVGFPYPHYQVADLRGLREAARLLGLPDHKEPNEKQHDALSDAIAQARTVQRLMAAFRGRLG